MLPTCLLSCWGAEAGGWQVEALAGLSMEYKEGLNDLTRFCLKIKKGQDVAQW